jgi:hypothetical protein
MTLPERAGFGKPQLTAVVCIVALGCLIVVSWKERTAGRR